MSHWASTWAYEQKIKISGRKFVLVALADFADENGYCFPAQDTLAGMTGQDSRSVRRHLAELEVSGFIKRKHRYEQKKRTSDGYHLLAPADRLKPSYRTDDPEAYRTNQPVDRLSADPSDPKDDPSVKKDPPLPPKGNGYRQPVKPPEEKYELPPNPFPMTNSLNVWLAEMCFSLSEQELAVATQTWRESRESRPDRRKRTMGMWQADWKKFIRIYWEIRQRNASGNGHKQGDGGDWDYHRALVAPEKPVDYFEKISVEYQRK